MSNLTSNSDALKKDNECLKKGQLQNGNVPILARLRIASTWEVSGLKGL